LDRKVFHCLEHTGQAPQSVPILLVHQTTVPATFSLVQGHRGSPHLQQRTQVANTTTEGDICAVCLLVQRKSHPRLYWTNTRPRLCRTLQNICRAQRSMLEYTSLGGSEHGVTISVVPSTPLKANTKGGSIHVFGSFERHAFENTNSKKYSSIPKKMSNGFNQSTSEYFHHFIKIPKSLPISSTNLLVPVVPSL
jgi:hypothetical protein